MRVYTLSSWRDIVWYLGECGRGRRLRERLVGSFFHGRLGCPLSNRRIKSLHILIDLTLLPLDIFPFFLSNRVRRIRVFSGFNRLHNP